MHQQLICRHFIDDRLVVCFVAGNDPVLVLHAALEYRVPDHLESHGAAFPGGRIVAAGIVSAGGPDGVHHALVPLVRIPAAEDDLDARPSHHDGADDHEHDDFDSVVIELDEVDEDNGSLSRTSLSVDDDDDIDLRSNNSFLHDNVD